jgi:hypothetical protein
MSKLVTKCLFLCWQYVEIVPDVCHIVYSINPVIPVQYPQRRKNGIFHPPTCASAVCDVIQPSWELLEIWQKIKTQTYRKKEAIGRNSSYPYTNICLHVILKAVDWKNPLSIERRLTFRNKLHSIGPVIKNKVMKYVDLRDDQTGNGVRHVTKRFRVCYC